MCEKLMAGNVEIVFLYFRSSYFDPLLFPLKVSYDYEIWSETQGAVWSLLDAAVVMNSFFLVHWWLQRKKEEWSWGGVRWKDSVMPYMSEIHLQLPNRHITAQKAHNCPCMPFLKASNSIFYIRKWGSVNAGSAQYGATVCLELSVGNASNATESYWLWSPGGWVELSTKTEDPLIIHIILDFVVHFNIWLEESSLELPNLWLISNHTSQ